MEIREVNKTEAKAIFENGGSVYAIEFKEHTKGDKLALLQGDRYYMDADPKVWDTFDEFFDDCLNDKVGFPEGFNLFAEV